MSKDLLLFGYLLMVMAMVAMLGFYLAPETSAELGWLGISLVATFGAIVALGKAVINTWWAKEGAAA